jgi:hypothetical protein
MVTAKIHEEKDSSEFRVAQTRCEPAARVAAAWANRDDPDRAPHRTAGGHSEHDQPEFWCDSRFAYLHTAEGQESSRCRKRPVGSKTGSVKSGQPALIALAWDFDAEVANPIPPLSRLRAGRTTRLMRPANIVKNCAVRR